MPKYRLTYLTDGTYSTVPEALEQDNEEAVVSAPNPEAALRAFIKRGGSVDADDVYRVQRLADDDDADALVRARERKTLIVGRYEAGTGEE